MLIFINISICLNSLLIKRSEKNSQVISTLISRYVLGLQMKINLRRLSIIKEKDACGRMKMDLPALSILHIHCGSIHLYLLELLLMDIIIIP